MKRRLAAFLLITLLLLAGASCANRVEPTPPVDPEPVLALAEVHFIDVGQGDAILILAGDKAVLIDGGDRSQGPVVVGYLRQQGITSLDLIIGTHPHADHIGGLIQVMREFEVKKIIDSGQPHTTQTYLTYLQLIDEKDIPFEVPTGQSIELAEDVVLDIIGPVKSYSSLNDGSVVAKLTAGAVSFLFTGDMEREAEHDLLAAEVEVAATVLKVGHHGSRTSTTDEFLAAVSPEVAVICVGKDNTYGHPHPSTLAKLTAIAVYRTDLHGHIVIVTDGEGYEVDTKSSEFPGEGEGDTLTATASMSDATPTQGSTISAIVNVTQDESPVAGAQVTVRCHFKSTTSTYTGTTDADGIAQIPFSIGQASKGYTVVVDVTVTYEGQTATTSTSFTPR